jgi:tripartite-type tricarboxylate transporter receptor subunit TctC
VPVATSAFDAVAKAPADGYTIVLGQTSNLAINPSLYSKLPYDPQKDLAPIVLIANAPLVMVTGTNSPLKTLADAVNAAKAKPGQVNFASPGNGTVAHLTEELFQRPPASRPSMCRTRAPTKALTDVISGNVELYMSSVPTLLGHIKQGQAPCAGGHVGQAGRRPSERTDDQRVRLQGIRRGDLVRPAGAGGPRRRT